MLWFGVFCFIFYALGAHGVSLEKMRQSLRPETGLVTVRSSNYSSVVLSGPRNYTLVVLFTTTLAEHRCVGCPMATSEFKAAAKSYFAAVGQEADVFFVGLDFKKIKEPFQWHALSHVPVVAVFPATTEDLSKSGAPSPGSVPLDPEYVVPAETRGVPSAKGMMKVIAKAKGWAEPLPVQRSATEVIPYLVGGAVLLALVGLLAADREWGLLSLPRDPWVWMAVSLMAYVVGVSGSVYCIIRNPPLYNRGAVPSLMAGDGQNVLEGVLMAAIYLGFGGAVILAVEAAKSGRSELQRTVVVSFALALAFMLFMRLVSLYAGKQRWYQIANLPPQVFKDTFNTYLHATNKRLQTTGVLEHVYTLTTFINSSLPEY